MPGVHANVMMVTAGRNKERRRHLRHDVKAKEVVVEVGGLRDVTYLEVNVTELGAGGQALKWFPLALGIRNHALDVDRIGRHTNSSVDPLPLIAGTVPIDLNAVAIRIFQV